MPNTVDVGARRSGDLVDFDTTPEVKVTLERTEKRIGLTVAWSTSDSPYAAWFLGKEVMPGLRVGGQTPTATPSRLVFYDSHGSVLLLGCWARGYHSALGGPGSGHVWASFAVLDVYQNIDFEKVNGLRTEISGLREWLGISSWAKHEDYRARIIELKSEFPDPIAAGTYGGVDLSFTPARNLTQVDKDSDKQVIHDLVWCQTRSSSLMGWGQHLTVHRAVRDLLVLSRWHGESEVFNYVMRSDDPLLTMDGKSHGEQWRAVVVADDAKAMPPGDQREHLIRYSELGEAGLLKWLALREEFGRALDPVISSIDLTSATPHTLLAHTGPGLEALGYLLFIHDGKTNKQASGKSLRARLERILAELGDSLPFDGPTWVDELTRDYNGLKHANRAAPDEVDVLNSWLRSILVVRAWVALELGVPTDEVKSRLQRDPENMSYERRR